MQCSAPHAASRPLYRDRERCTPAARAAPTPPHLLSIFFPPTKTCPPPPPQSRAAPPGKNLSSPALGPPQGWTGRPCTCAQRVGGGANPGVTPGAGSPRGAVVAQLRRHLFAACASGRDGSGGRGSSARRRPAPATPCLPGPATLRPWTPHPCLPPRHSSPAKPEQALPRFQPATSPSHAEGRAPPKLESNGLKLGPSLPPRGLAGSPGQHRLQQNQVL